MKYFDFRSPLSADSSSIATHAPALSEPPMSRTPVGDPELEAALMLFMHIYAYHFLYLSFISRR